MAGGTLGWHAEKQMHAIMSLTITTDASRRRNVQWRSHRRGVRVYASKSSMHDARSEVVGIAIYWLVALSTSGKDRCDAADHPKSCTSVPTTPLLLHTSRHLIHPNDINTSLQHSTRISKSFHGTSKTLAGVAWTNAGGTPAILPSPRRISS